MGHKIVTFIRNSQTSRKKTEIRWFMEQYFNKTFQRTQREARQFRMFQDRWGMTFFRENTVGTICDVTFHFVQYCGKHSGSLRWCIPITVSLFLSSTRWTGLVKRMCQPRRNIFGRRSDGSRSAEKKVISLNIRKICEKCVAILINRMHTVTFTTLLWDSKPQAFRETEARNGNL